jgi:hypothetical protein
VENSNPCHSTRVSDEESKLKKDSDRILLPISILKADHRNPRKISDESLAGLKVSLEVFGPLDIVFNDETGERFRVCVEMDGCDRGRRSQSGRSAKRMHYWGGEISGLRARLWEPMGHERLLALGSKKPADRATEIYSRIAWYLVNPRIKNIEVHRG